MKYEGCFERVSDQLVSADTGLISNMAGFRSLDNTWDLGSRSLDDHLIYYICSGTGNAVVDGHSFNFRPDMFIWLTPGMEHHFWKERSDRGHMVLYHFRFQISDNSECDIDPGYIIRSSMHDSRKLVELYYDENQFVNSDSSQRMKSLLYLMLSNCFSNARTDKSNNPFNQAMRQKIFEFTRENLKTRPNVKDMAVRVGLCHDYFSRIFKKSFGVSPSSWLVQERIGAVAEELEYSTRSISEIAYDYGYEDIFFFSKQFKQIKGCSPRKWRKMK
jgi:AraC-like DNA-binding protein